MARNTVVGFIVIGLIVGVLVGFGLNTAIKPTKTVTKTQTVSKIVKIENGMPLSAVIKVFGNPAGVTQAPSAANNQVECVGWALNSSGRIATPGDWSIVLCGKVK